MQVQSATQLGVLARALQGMKHAAEEALIEVQWALYGEHIRTAGGREFWYFTKYLITAPESTSMYRTSSIAKIHFALTRFH